MTAVPRRGPPATVGRGGTELEAIAREVPPTRARAGNVVVGARIMAAGAMGP